MAALVANLVTRRPWRPLDRETIDSFHQVLIIAGCVACLVLLSARG
jgi:hypothetical protein